MLPRRRPAPDKSALRMDNPCARGLLREREFADWKSGHTGDHRPQALAVQLLSVSSPPQTRR